MSGLVKPEDLTAMKYMCKEIIGRRNLEKITNFFDLCDNLESRDMLHKNNVDFLQRLLQDCCSGRTDVLHVLERYTNPDGIGNVQVPNQMHQTESNYLQRNANVPPQVVYVTQMPGTHPVVPSTQSYTQSMYSYQHIEKDVTYLTRKLGREWRFFMRALGVSDYVMAEMEQQYPRSMRDQIHGCFMSWVQQRKGVLDKKMLINALQDVSVERYDLSGDLEEDDFT